MKIAVITDLHGISPTTKFKEIQQRRSFFADAWPSFLKLVKLLRFEDPDLVISLGDVVDWYSDHNRDFALSLLDELPCSWLMVPGNHDFESYKADEDGIHSISASEGRVTSTNGWKDRGIELHNRYIDTGDSGLTLLDSAASGFLEGTREWLHEINSKHDRQLWFTHVPLDIPETRDFILAADPTRNMKKYVQSSVPWVYRELLQRKESYVFTGHLHFPGYLGVGNTQMHMLDMCISDLRRPQVAPSAAVIEIGKSIAVRYVSPEV